MAMFEKKMTVEEAKEGLADVVSVYQNKWIESVKAKETEAMKLVLVSEEAISDYEKEVIRSAETDRYAYTCDILNIKAHLRDARVVWNEYNSHVLLTLMLEDLDDAEGSMRMLGKYRKLPVSGVTYIHYSRLKKANIEALKVANKYGNLLRNKADKEKEIYNKVLEVRLKKTGLADLLDLSEVNDLLIVD